ncbi:hypothetical protein JXA70_10470 [candidate division KSB1 bacterium]|nr:hypothetical protein [candidate division KSB1 bacterium]
MRNVSKILVLLATITFAVSCGPKQQKAVADIVVAYPDNAKIVFENDYVKAVEFTLKPGDQLPLHQGGARVIYALSDYKIKWTEGGETIEKEWQRGDTHWHDAIDHAVENIGDTEAQYLVVTRTETPLPETGDFDVSRDASQVDSENATILFENDIFRIIDVKLDPGESQPKHEGIYRLIYSLNDYRAEYNYYRLNTIEAEMEESLIHWHVPEEHSVKNVGETPAHYLIFAVKK